MGFLYKDYISTFFLLYVPDISVTNTYDPHNHVHYLIFHREIFKYFRPVHYIVLIASCSIRGSKGKKRRQKKHNKICTHTPHPHSHTLTHTHKMTKVMKYSNIHHPLPLIPSPLYVQICLSIQAFTVLQSRYKWNIFWKHVVDIQLNYGLHFLLPDQSYQLIVQSYSHTHTSFPYKFTFAVKCKHY